MTRLLSKPNAILNRGLFFMLLMALLSSGMYSCKSKKKLTRKEAAAAEARKIAKAKADLEMVITDDGQLTLEEKEEIVRNIKAMNIQDSEVQMLLSHAENRVERARAERLATEREKRMEAEKSAEKKMNLDEYFSAIASASSGAEADRLINETLRQFTTDDALVLIIIGKFGNEKDYDRPTTIRKYLYYLKDQKKNLNKVESVVFDANGKIEELELIRK